MNLKTRPNCIIIMDGYGYNPSDKGNAVKAADSKNVKEFLK